MAEGQNGSPATVSSFPEDKRAPSGLPLSIFKEIPDPRYLCSHCKAVLKGALQTSCGHCYCSACLAWIVRNNKNPVCQRCKEEDPGFTENEENVLSVEKVEKHANFLERLFGIEGEWIDADDKHHLLKQRDQAFSDVAVNKEISELGVRCGTPGCSWTGDMQTLEAHRSTGECARVSCHVGCRGSATERRFATNCTSTPSCYNGLQEVSGDGHQQNLSAVPNDKRCRFSRIGCLFQGSREESEDHEKTAEGVHLILLLQLVKQLKATLNLADRGFSSDVTDFRVPNGIVLSLRLEGALEADSFSGLPLNEEGTGCRTLTRQADGIALLETKLRVFDNITSVLSKEMDSSRQKIATFRGQRGLDQDTIRGLELKIADLQRCLAQKDAALSKLQERLQLSEQASYDGVFVWRIVDVHRKCYEAMCGKVCSLQSPAFYTARYGYKMCLRIFLNGKGRSKGSYVSLFLVLLKGEYDALLQWPFAQKITFMLLDQNNGEPVVNSFLADPASTSFQRPVTDMNEQSGCSRFLPLAKLRSLKYSYIKEGVLFLKCKVEASL